MSSRGKDTEAEYLFNQAFVLGPDVQNVSPSVHFFVYMKQSFNNVLVLVDCGGKKQNRTVFHQVQQCQGESVGDPAKESWREFASDR